MARELEKIEAAFLWGGNNLKRKVHLLKWVEASKSIDQGGLGIRRIRDINTCLLLKWWWKFGTQINALWRRVICSKYKIIENCWHPLVRPSYKHSRIWSDILSIRASSNSIFNFFLANCLIKVGNENRIKFWTDRWCGGIFLKSDFPLLFNLSTDKEGSLHQFCARKTSSCVWNFPHRRELYDWELAEEASLIAALSSAPPLCNENADYLIWSNDAAGHNQFSVSGLYSYSTSLLGPNLRICKHVWSSLLNPKVSFFC